MILRLLLLFFLLRLAVDGISFAYMTLLGISLSLCDGVQDKIETSDK